MASQLTVLHRHGLAVTGKSDPLASLLSRMVLGIIPEG
jgi:hypothetical protein